MSAPVIAIARGPIRSATGPLSAPTTKKRLIAIDRTHDNSPRDAAKLACREAKNAENEYAHPKVANMTANAAATTVQPRRIERRAISSLGRSLDADVIYECGEAIMKLVIIMRPSRPRWRRATEIRPASPGGDPNR